ncbi:hypothetical protein M5K25_001674 [Dendrobium thyrsiflorum]|uniref:Uncharacterized protein n=1 Tax=Dendrobium thyrsiflorum TaxID=117978 RepID=A0ABD0VR31_DENTH
MPPARRIRPSLSFNHRILNLAKRAKWWRRSSGSPQWLPNWPSTFAFGGTLGFTSQFLGEEPDRVIPGQIPISKL